MRNGRIVGATETLAKKLGACRKKGGLSATFAKRKRNRAICLHHQIVKWERVKEGGGGESSILERKRGIRAGARAGEDSTVKEGGLQGGEEGQRELSYEK